VAASSVGWETLEGYGIARPACVLTASLDEAIVFLDEPPEDAQVDFEP
jgi:hypothetical protein